MPATTGFSPTGYQHRTEPCDLGGKCLRVWLIRHGQSESNAGHASVDAASIPLTRIGERQASAVAAALPEQPTKIIVSGYCRSRHTGAIVQERFPEAPLVEWPVQEFTYLPHHAYFQTTVQDRRELVDRYWCESRPHEVLDSGSESFAKFMQRVLNIKERLFSESSGPLVMVSHKKFLSGLLWTLLTGETAVSSRQMRRYRGFDHGLSLRNGAIIELILNRNQSWFGPIQLAHLP